MLIYIPLYNCRPTLVNTLYVSWWIMSRLVPDESNREHFIFDQYMCLEEILHRKIRTKLLNLRCVLCVCASGFISLYIYPTRLAYLPGWLDSKIQWRADGEWLLTALPSNNWWDDKDYTQYIIDILCAFETSCLHSSNGQYPYRLSYPWPYWNDGN